MTKQLVQEYAMMIAPLLPLAKKAYGSRDTISPQHDASREYTRLLVEFVDKEGSLLQLAEALGVTYAGMRRRVTTATLPPSSKRARRKFSDDDYDTAVYAILHAKRHWSTESYHRHLADAYDRGLSMARIAKEMGLSSANPLYYGINRVKLKEQEDKKNPA